MQARSVNLRERILDTASGLFYKHGLRNVGIDRIIAESGIARMTLYNHFKSKDLLIEEYLRRASSRWMKWYAGKIERASDDPRERLLAAFSVLDGWFRSRDFRGALRTLLASTNPQMSEAELRERVATQAEYCDVEAAAGRLDAWAEDDPVEAGRALGDRLWVLTASGVGGPWLPSDEERDAVNDELYPEARFKFVERLPVQSLIHRRARFRSSPAAYSIDKPCP